MSFKFQVSSFKFKIQSLDRKISVLNFTFAFLLFTFSCSVPNLETKDCTAARNNVKKLYSFHFGNDMKPSPENLKSREEFLTPELKQELEKQTSGESDYFTQTGDYPKAFRLGECKVAEPEKTVNLQVLLFWKDESRSEQKEINVEVVKQNNNWLVNKVEKK